MQPSLHPPKLYRSLALTNSDDTTACILFYRGTPEEKDCEPSISSYIEEIFHHEKKVILIEGAPGIGKTTLCKEIAFRWAKGEQLTSCKLLLLLPLRDPDVQKTSTIHEFSEYFVESTNKSSLLCSYLENKGDVTIILDGFDEMDSELRNSFFFTELIQGKLLPKARIVVTSRPSTSTCLHNIVDQVVEIIGFHQSGRNQYALEVLKDSPPNILRLQKHLQQHPSIDALCYIPLIMSIITFVCLHQPTDLPSTASKMYRSFIMLTICEYLKSKKIIPKDKVINNKEQFPPVVKKVLRQLAKFAFNSLVADKLVFTAEEISHMCKDDPTCYGLLQSVECRNSVKSYNFLHLTIQEYLAAYHITTLQSGEVDQLLHEAIFNGSCKSSSDKSIRLSNMWIMYVGITGGKNSSLRHQLELITRSQSGHDHCNPVFDCNTELLSGSVSVLPNCPHDSPTRTVPPLLSNNSLQLSCSELLPLSTKVQCLMLNNQKTFATSIMRLKAPLTGSCCNNIAFSQEIENLGRIFYLFQCFQEAEDEIICDILSKSFERNIINLKDCNILYPHQVESLGLFLTSRRWESLNLSNCQVGDKGIILLHRYLCRDKQEQISVIDFMENNLTEVSLPFISDIITYCHPRTLKLGCNDFACVENIAKAVITSPSLKQLNLWGCGITAEEAAVISDMMATLEELVISNNNLSDDGVKILSGGLATTKTLRELYINDNNISPQGTVTIACALTLNTSLEILNMTNNIIGQEGAVAIAEAIVENKTLSELLLYGDYTLNEESAKLLLERLSNSKSTISKLGFSKRLVYDNCIKSCIESINITRRRNNIQELNLKFH